MKKIFLIPVLFLTLFVSMNKVNADSLLASQAYNNFTSQVSLLTTYSSEISQMKTYWSNNFASFCPYYVIHVYYVDNGYNLSLNCLDSVYFSKTYSNSYIQSSLFLEDNNNKRYQIDYNTNTSTFTYYPDNENLNARALWYFNGYNISDRNGLQILDSNFNPIFKSSEYLDGVSTPAYSDGTYNFPVYNISDGDILPTISSLYNGTYSPDIITNYTEIDLNDYSYVILSLKNYNQSPFTTNIYTLGSLCLTPVYNYGMKEKSEILGSAYVVQNCSQSYDVFTPVSITISANDLEYNSVYYVKAFDSSTNKIKVNSDVFNISYISSSEANNPYVLAGGREYPAIPFNTLTSTANKSTAEGYVPGVSCSVGDLNCYAEYNDFNFADIFTHPLELLQSFWSSIVAIFSMITAFIMLLPPTLQIFMFSAFMFAVILGLIKIIL